MKYFQYIQDVDGNPPDPMDLVDIQESRCNNCQGRRTGKIMFVRLANGTLIWWHLMQCTFHETH